MATSVRFISITRQGPADPRALEPAPSVRDWEAITTGLKGVEPIEGVDALLTGSHFIRGGYRGWVLWLYPNVRFHRHDPKSSGGNGYAGEPIPGTQENVIMRMDEEVFIAEVEFL